MKKTKQPKQRKQSTPELLSPVQDFVSLRATIDAGCDAVYFGVKDLNMRINAKNFSISDIKKVVKLCHSSGVKAYLTLNTIIYEGELKKAEKILTKAKQASIDAVIAWDNSVIQQAKKLKLKVHLSTQAGVSNSTAANAYKKQGVRRIVCARECTLKQIAAIKKKTNVEIETFVHGAMCISVSGRCFISEELFGKSANRGDCLQPCRRMYKITDIEEKNKLNIGHNFVLSPKDLCTLPVIDKLIKAGVDSFKIEGRNRSPEYVKTVTGCYREAINAVTENRFNKKLVDKLMKKIRSVYNRGFSSGFFLGKPTDKDFCRIYGSKATTRKVYVGYVNNFYNKIKVAEIKLQSGGLRVKDKLMIQGPTTGVYESEVKSMQLNHKDVKSAKKGSNIAVKVSKIIRKNDKVYVVKETK